MREGPLEVGRPRLRVDLEPHPVELDGDAAYALRDPYDLAPTRRLVLPAAGLALAALLDGTRTLEDARLEFARRHGVEVDPEDARQLLDALEEACCVSGGPLSEAVAAARAEPLRAPACIGSYPGDPEALRAFLAEEVTREGGPGVGGAVGEGVVRGIVSPHIDPIRGGHNYAWVWREVARRCAADTFVVFGTAHRGTAPVERPGSRHPRFALTFKDFVTPLGTAPTDRAVVEALLAAYDGPEDLLAGELHHRLEHSVEFQAVHLLHALPERPLTIVPVLCGPLAHDRDPSGDPALAAFHRALREALSDRAPERVAFVAGVDLAHVGAQFGEAPVGEVELAELERRDRETLRVALEDRDADAVHRDIVADGDARKICGHAPLVALLQALDVRPQVRGRLWQYDRWHDGASAVSFAAATYDEPSETP